MALRSSLLEDGQLLDRPANQLLDNFAAGGASPGSGSAAALMALLAAKLLVTAAEKTIEKVRRSEASKWSYIKSQIQEMEPRLAALFEKDAREFEQVVDFRRKRDRTSNVRERTALARRANDLLEVATDNVFEISDHSVKLIDHGVTLFKDGWHAVRGDSGAAISAALAGAMSGIFVASLNIKTLGNRAYSRGAMDRCEQLYREVTAKQNSAFSCVAALNQEALQALQLELLNSEPGTG